jgi:quercetin dioxygenase-like cupin family protein
MKICTPGLEPQHRLLSNEDSRYVVVQELKWHETEFPGIRSKVLMHDPDSGMQTVLTEMAPGSVLPDHIHQAVEQSYVIRGKLVDHQSSATEGNFVWRPAGSRHTAHSPEGALILSFFIKPNLFVKK